jgi:hypothetical protein
MSTFKKMEKDKFFDEKQIKSNNGFKLLKNVIKASKIKKEFGMGIMSIYKTISILFNEYHQHYLSNEKGKELCSQITER